MEAEGVGVGRPPAQCRSSRLSIPERQGAEEEGAEAEQGQEASTQEQGTAQMGFQGLTGGHLQMWPGTGDLREDVVQGTHTGRDSSRVNSGDDPMWGVEIQVTVRRMCVWEQGQQSLAP